MPKTAESLIQIYHSEMAGVEQAKKALWALLRCLNAGRPAKLTVTTVKGSLKVCLEESFTKENMLKNKSTKRVSPSHLRRKERRAADPAVRQRAAQHQAREAATAPPMEKALHTPEKERRSSATSSLQVSPVKDDTREEAGDEQVAKEEADGEQWAGEVPKDYNEYANYSEWFWEHDVKGRDDARKLMGETDRWCFCDYECPPPTQLEDESRIMGNLMSLYDHIELSHPVAHQWMA